MEGLHVINKPRGTYSQGISPYIPCCCHAHSLLFVVTSKVVGSRLDAFAWETRAFCQLPIMARSVCLGMLIRVLLSGNNVSLLRLSMLPALVLHSLNNLLILLTLIFSILHSCVIFVGFFL